MKKEPLSLQANVMWNTVGMSVYLGCQWLITIMVVRLSTDFNNSGLLAVSMAVTNIFYGIACYNMRSYQVSDVTGKYRDTVYVQMRFITCAIAYAGCIIYALFLYRDIRFICILLYMLFKVLEAIVDVLHGIDQKAGYMNVIGVSMILRGIGTLSAFCGILLLTDSLLMAIGGMVAVSAVCILGYDISRVKDFFQWDREFFGTSIKRLLTECLPLGIASSLGTAIISIPRNMLDYMEGSEMLGIYGAIATPAVIVQVMATYIFNPMLSVYAMHYQSNDKKAFYRLLRQTLALLGVLSVTALAGAYLLKDMVLPILLGDKITSYTYLFLPMLFGTILNAFVGLLTNLLIVVRKFRVYLGGSILAVILVTVVSPFFIHAYSMSGVNAAVILVMAVQVLIFSYALSREFTIHFAEHKNT